MHPFLTGPVTFLACAGCVLAGAPVPAPDTMEERLQTLERQVRALAGENRELKRQLGWNADTGSVLARPGGHEAKLVVGGFLQGQAEFGRLPDPRWTGVRDRFFFRRARMYLAGSFADDFDFKAEIDLQGNTLGAGAGQLARANEIYLGWHKYRWAGLRFGQLKPAFGGEALASDTAIHTIERSLSNDRLADGRQLAVSAGGLLGGNRLSYLAVLANGNGANVSANDNSGFQKSARLALIPIGNKTDQVSVGVDGLWSDDTAIAKGGLGFAGNLFSGRREMVGTDFTWTHAGFSLSGEWLHGTFHPADRIPAARLESAGWYVTATCFLVPSRLQAVVRQESFDPDMASAGNTFRTTTFGLNYFLRGDAVKFMVNYLDGTMPGSNADGGRLLTRVQIVF